MTSSLFADDGYMPLETAGLGVGDNKSPPLKIALSTHLDEIKSLVLICQDIDVPIPFPITHFLAYGIAPGEVVEFGLDDLSETNNGSEKCSLGTCSLGKVGWIGPRPVPGHGDHRYVFQVFGLNEAASQAISDSTTRLNTDQIVEIIQGNVVAFGALTGKYRRD